MAKEVDCGGSSRPVWLVKIPKYLADVWNHVDESGVVGSLLISKNKEDKEFILQLSEPLVQATAEKCPAPSEHRLIVKEDGQSQAVFSESLPHAKDDEKEEDEEGNMNSEICLEGVVMHKADCKPMQTPQYMSLKKQSILSSRAPSRQTRQLDGVVTTTYLPKTKHRAEDDYAKKKKQEGKRARADRGHVLDMLFKAFERHQYYHMKDLITLTQQPHDHLKEILRSICIYNKKNPNKSTWQLKPEYRHYDNKEST